MSLTQMHSAYQAAPHCHGANGDMLYNVHGLLLFPPDQSEQGVSCKVKDALAAKQIQHNWTIDMWVQFRTKQDSSHLFALFSLPVQWKERDGSTSDERLNVYYRPVDKSLFVRITHQWYPMYQHFLDTNIHMGWNHLTFAWTTQKRRQVKKNGLDVNLNGRAHANFGFPVNRHEPPVFFPRAGQLVYFGYTPEVGGTVSLAHEHQRQQASEDILEKSMLQGSSSCGDDSATPPEERLRGAIRRGGDKTTSTSVDVFRLIGGLHTIRFYDDYMTFGDSNTLMCEYAQPSNRHSHSKMMTENHLFGFVVDKDASDLATPLLYPVNAHVPHHSSDVAHRTSEASIMDPNKYVSRLFVGTDIIVERLTPKGKQVDHVLSRSPATTSSVEPKTTRKQYNYREMYQVLHDTHYEPYTSPQVHQPPSEKERSRYKTITYKKSLWSTGLLSFVFVVFLVLLYVLYLKEHRVAEDEVYELVRRGYSPQRIVSMTPRRTIY